jgi:hypothetical protein
MRRGLGVIAGLEVFAAEAETQQCIVASSGEHFEQIGKQIAGHGRKIEKYVKHQGAAARGCRD